MAKGISKVGELIDLGVKAGVVEKSGAWFSYDSQRIGQGRENAKQFLRDHQDMADAIEAQGPRAVGRGGEYHAGDERRDGGGGGSGGVRLRRRRPRRIADRRIGRQTSSLRPTPAFDRLWPKRHDVDGEVISRA